MELLVLDQNFIAQGVVDKFESLIWTDRYIGYGDFELYTLDPTGILNLVQHRYYLVVEDSDHVMIVEKIEVDSDFENGNRIIVTGRSLEAILDRRIVWKQTSITGNFQNGILKLLNENVINPVDTTRKIDNFIFEASTDPSITSLTISAQFTGDNLYATIKRLCEVKSVGFKIRLSDDNKFVFSLYSGADRTYDQVENPYVIFSPSFENLMNSNYFESTIPVKTVALVAGEGEGLARKTRTVPVSAGAGAGLARSELYVDARDISQTVDGVLISDADYNEQLDYRGLEYLADNVFAKSFEGQVETINTFKYGEEYFMGDIVQIVNEYGIESTSRVVELVRSQSLVGLEVYPTFSTVE